MLHLILTFMQKSIAFAVLAQTLEILLMLRKGARLEWYSWQVLRQDFAATPFMVRKFLDASLAERPFVILLILQLLACGILLSAWEIGLNGSFLLGGIFLITLLISLRWRGAFNGGSDSMTLIVLGCLTVAALFQIYPRIVLACLFYIALQVLLSFFIAGAAKLRQTTWRSGQELQNFFRLGQYGAPTYTRSWANYPRLCRIASWGIIFFELSFPLALLGPRWAFIYISLALFFHLVNFYLIGLNRFFFAWLAGYPALFYCSLYMSQ